MAKLHFFHSVMDAGKSMQLLQARHNYIANDGHVLLFTSAIDDRAGVGTIASRLGFSAPAHPLRSDENLFELVRQAHLRQPVTVVMMDEVQFLKPGHIEQASDIVDQLGIPVMCYGLKNNVFGELFSPAISKLLALAEDIKEIKQLCHCGDKATMILRYDPDGRAVKQGEVIEIGGNSRYVSVCRPHWKSGDIGASRRKALGLDIVCAAA